MSSRETAGEGAIHKLHKTNNFYVPQNVTLNLKRAGEKLLRPSASSSIACVDHIKFMIKHKKPVKLS